MDTSHLVSLLDRLSVGRGAAFLGVAGPFPVAGPASWSNDWHVRRCEPYPHLHEGIDIFAPHGTPVVAVADGRISQRVAGAISGLSVELTDRNGVQYFYAHLSSIASGVVPGMEVRTGQVLGSIGTTGNARGTSPHLHLEVQPGGSPVPPKSYVDRWLAVAERRAVAWLRSPKADAHQVALFAGHRQLGTSTPWVASAPSADAAFGSGMNAAIKGGPSWWTDRAAGPYAVAGLGAAVAFVPVLLFRPKRRRPATRPRPRGPGHQAARRLRRLAAVTVGRSLKA